MNTLNQMNFFLDVQKRRKRAAFDSMIKIKKNNDKVSKLIQFHSHIDAERFNYIDMVLNPQKETQYQIDVAKAEKDIRAEKR